MKVSVGLFVALCNTEYEKMSCRCGGEENCLDLQPETGVTSVTGLQTQ